MSREELFKKEVKKSVAKIKSQYQPDKIYIFGSFASGKITVDSDLDFFIIKKTVKSRRDRQREVSRILIDRQVPMDILVFTPAETEKRKNLGDQFILNILNFGRLVYAKK
ncbi:MAG: nucleotidyltransferase domain-containing protein [bacterium]|nr:nucleotidyltransferase domain-containing protein [bacterium]